MDKIGFGGGAAPLGTGSITGNGSSISFGYSNGFGPFVGGGFMSIITGYGAASSIFQVSPNAGKTCP